MVYEYCWQRLEGAIRFCSDNLIGSDKEISMFKVLILVDSKEKLQEVKQDILSSRSFKEFLSNKGCTIQIKTQSNEFNIVFCPTGSELRVVYTDFNSPGRRANMILYNFERCDAVTKRIIQSFFTQHIAFT